MTEHSIEELERQLQQADDKARAASLSAREARSRLWQAKFEATGFKGCIAEYQKQPWPNKEPKTVRFLPVRVSRSGNYIEGPLLKKDGNPGERLESCSVEKAKNLGPYSPTEAA